MFRHPGPRPRSQVITAQRNFFTQSEAFISKKPRLFVTPCSGDKNLHTPSDVYRVRSADRPVSVFDETYESSAAYSMILTIPHLEFYPNLPIKSEPPP